MTKRIVVALGGNALGNNLEEQIEAVKHTAKAVVDLIEEGHEVIVAHGNGPQVGMIQLAMEGLTKTDPKKYSHIPLFVCGAMSQSYIGFGLQNALREELLSRGIGKPVATVVTQIKVDAADPSFKNPTKPIGGFMTKEEADVMVSDKGISVVEDSGRGYRQVVASPQPKEIVEIETIKALIAAGQVVISCGGGGIPVLEKGNQLEGVDAVIDKDFCSELLAEELDADLLIILTAVEKAYVNFGKENQEAISEVTVAEIKKHVEDGQFAPGSMKPKVEAAIRFAESKPGRKALITLLEKAKEGIAGETGTLVQM